MYIKPSIYNYKYFGLKPDIYNEILFPINGIGTYSNIINMNNFSLIVIKVLGLVEQNKTLDNFNSSISRGDVCGLVVLGVNGTLRTIPTVGILWGGSFSFPPEPL